MFEIISLVFESAEYTFEWCSTEWKLSVIILILCLILISFQTIKAGWHRIDYLYLLWFFVMMLIGAICVYMFPRHYISHHESSSTSIMSGSLKLSIQVLTYIHIGIAILFPFFKKKEFLFGIGFGLLQVFLGGLVLTYYYYYA